MQDTTNYMEVWVKDYMKKLLKESDICTCEKCQRDIYAHSLNNLKPFYVSTTKGRLMTKINGMQQQFETDIIIEITKAINVIKNNPRHDK